MDRLNEDIPRIDKNKRYMYYEFFKEFKDYITEYYRDSLVELTIAEIMINKPIKIFDGFTPGKVKLKNQGSVSCYLSPTGQGGYRIDPGETIDFYVNSQVMATTISGTTVLGFIKS